LSFYFECFSIVSFSYFPGKEFTVTFLICADDPKSTTKTDAKVTTRAGRSPSDATAGGYASSAASSEVGETVVDPGVDANVGAGTSTTTGQHQHQQRHQQQSRHPGDSGDSPNMLAENEDGGGVTDDDDDDYHNVEAKDNGIVAADSSKSRKKFTVKVTTLKAPNVQVWLYVITARMNDCSDFALNSWLSIRSTLVEFSFIHYAAKFDQSFFYHLLYLFVLIKHSQTRMIWVEMLEKALELLRDVQDE
jgi:hypothetical protein